MKTWARCRRGHASPRNKLSYSKLIFRQITNQTAWSSVSLQCKLNCHCLGLPYALFLPAQLNLTDKLQNWFQNRRAKAKQQRKQEEFEVNQGQPFTSAVEDDQDDDVDLQAETKVSAQAHQQDSTPLAMPAPASESAATSIDQKASQEASWASLQRALTQAKAEQVKHHQEIMHHTQMQRAQSNGVVPHQIPNQLSNEPPSNPAFVHAPPPWQHRQSLMEPWSPTNQFQDTTFDFGFGHAQSAASHDNTQQRHPADFIPETQVMPQGPWQEGLPTPTGTMADNVEAHFIGSPDLHLPQYPGSRRGSVAESLTANFGHFALASESPQSASSSCHIVPEVLRQPDGPLDLAARRKRPRPAALTSSALRSRSYGALTSVSPTVRPGMMPAPHAVRHVKSTGHSLNARFGGIRKASSAQRSPINVATFAEAEAFHRLMAQQAAANAQSYGPDASTPIVPTSAGFHTPTQTDEHSGFAIQRMDLASRFQLPNTQHLTLNTTSPPATPFDPHFVHHGQHLSMPPVSAPPQYATFPEFTPPYSAGPLTNSSWSDAPLTSPDMPNFPQVTYIPSLKYAPKMESPQSQFQQFVLPSDSKPDLHTTNASPEQKKMEFFIQEFPNQKEEHAHVAQQLASNRPKNYVFANSAPSDYDQS